MSITWGRPGIEAQHVINGLALNERHPARAWRIVLDKIGGLYGLGEIEDARRSAGSQRGEIALPVYPRGKTLTYEGRVEARTLAAWRTAYRTLTAACRNRNTEHLVTILGDTDWFFQARVLQLDADDDPSRLDPRRPWPFTGTFVLGLRQSDARYYALPLVQHPDSGGGSITNSGNTDTDPTIFFHTAGGDVTLQNTTYGRTLIFRDLDAGDYEVRFGAPRHVIRTNNGADFSGHMDVDDSNWWDELIPGLSPGVNVLAITGVTAWRADFYYADE